MKGNLKYGQRKIESKMRIKKGNVMKKLLFYLFSIYLTGCVQFTEKIEEGTNNNQVSAEDKKNNTTNKEFKIKIQEEKLKSKGLAFTSLASTLDSREYGTINLKKLKDNYPNASQFEFFSETKSVFMSFTKEELAKRDSIQIRKFKEKYFANIVTKGKSTTIIFLDI